ncbi:MAG: hypothetical protein ABJC26_15195 [Gemmatimonadaceae bacterium]
MTSNSAPTRLLYLLSAIFLVIGVTHFVAPHSFERIVPAWVPDARMAVIFSGVAEVAGGIGLLIPATRRLAGWCLIALLIAVFPANIHMLQLARNAHESALNIAILWIRLPFQPLLIWWLWKAAVRNRGENY